MSSETALLKQALEAHRSFSQNPDKRPILAAFSPFRFNIIGGHIDNFEGFALTFPAEGFVILGVERSDGGPCRLLTTFNGESFDVVVKNIRPDSKAAPSPRNSIIGVLSTFYSRAALDPAFAFDAVIVCDDFDGDTHANLASLEIALVTFLEVLTGKTLDKLEKVRFCQDAAKEYCGIIESTCDEVVCEFAKRGSALKLDCASREVSNIMISDNYKLLISKFSSASSPPMKLHELLADRISETREMPSRISVGCTWRGLDTGKAEEAHRAGRIGEPALKRTRHIIGESSRALSAAEFLVACDMEAVGRCMSESHASLRDEFEIRCKEAEALVEIAVKQAGVLGSRLHPSSGSLVVVVSLVRSDFADNLQVAISREFEAQCPEAGPCQHRLVSPAGGARRLDLGHLVPEQNGFECILRARMLKEEGNALLKAGKHQLALEKYHRMYMSGIGGLIKPSQGSGGSGVAFQPPNKDQEALTSAEKEQVKELARSMHSNKALCYLKLEKWEKGLDACTRALELDADEAKMRQRRGICYMKSNDLDRARADLERVQELLPDDASVKRDLAELARLDKVQDKRSKAAFQKMFS